MIRGGSIKESSKQSLKEGEGVSHMDMGRWGMEGHSRLKSEIIERKSYSLRKIERAEYAKKEKRHSHLRQVGS